MITTLVVDDVFRLRLDETLTQDILPDLSTMTGHQFSVTNTVPAGWKKKKNMVIFVLAQSTVAGYNTAAGPSIPNPIPVEVKNDLDRLIGKPQAFLIDGASGRGVWIVAEGWRGARHGLFELLHLLGARYFLPGEDWKIIPSQSNIYLPVHELREPSFDTIFWAGSGNSFAEMMTDSKHPGRDTLAQDAWLRWLRQNRRPIGNGTYWAHAVDPELQPIGGQGAVPSALDDLNNKSLNSADPIHDPFNFAWISDTDVSQPGRSTFDAIPELRKGYLNFTYHGCGSPSNPHECQWSPAIPATSTPAIDTEQEDPWNYVSYGGVIKLIGEWLDNQINLYLSAGNVLDPDVVPTFSVDPVTDNENNKKYWFCWCPKCLNLLRNGPYGFGPAAPDSSLSDRAFHFASQIARHVVSNPKYAHSLLSVYAYYETTSVPTIPLHPSLLVVLDPYLFAGNFLPEVLIDQWRAKSDSDGFQLDVYDHWIPTGVRKPTPSFSLRNSLNRFRFWRSRRIRVFTGESTTSMGVVGLHWYLAQCLAWNPTADVDALLNEFFTKAFGASAATIRRVFDRWWPLHAEAAAGYVGYEPSAYEFGELFADLAKAHQLVAGKDEQALKRIGAIEAYAQFLMLYQNYKALRNQVYTPAEIEVSARLLFQLIWRSYDTLYLNSYDVYWTILYDGGYSPEFTMKWTFTPTDRTNPATVAQDATDWRRNPDINVDTPLDPQELLMMMQDGQKVFPRLDLTIVSASSDDLIPKFADPTGLPTENPDYPIAGNVWPTEEATWFAFYVMQNQAGNLTFTAEAFDGNVGQVRLIISGPGKFLVADVTFYPDGGYQADHKPEIKAVRSFSLATLDPGLYQAQVFLSGNSSYTVAYPGNLPFVRIGNQFWHMTDPKKHLYFFMPQGITRFAYYTEHIYPDQSGNTGPIFMAGTVLVQAKLARHSTNTWIVNVPDSLVNKSPTQAPAKVWALSHYSDAYHLINLPNIFARSASQLMVPRNLWF